MSEEYFILINIISFYHLQVAQHNAVTPLLLSFLDYHLDYEANSHACEEQT
jgi:3-dehydroquinate dehydratase